MEEESDSPAAGEGVRAGAGAMDGAWTGAGAGGVATAAAAGEGANDPNALDAAGACCQEAGAVEDSTENGEGAAAGRATGSAGAIANGEEAGSGVAAKGEGAGSDGTAANGDACGAASKGAAAKGDAAGSKPKPSLSSEIWKGELLLRLSGIFTPLAAEPSSATLKGEPWRGAAANGLFAADGADAAGSWTTENGLAVGFPGRFSKMPRLLLMMKEHLLWRRGHETETILKSRVTIRWKSTFPYFPPAVFSGGS